MEEEEEFQTKYPASGSPWWKSSLLEAAGRRGAWLLIGRLTVTGTAARQTGQLG